MSRKLWLVCLLVGLFFSLGAGQDDKSYSADSFDVAVTVAEDGSLLVQETVTFRFVGGPFTFVFRELPTDHTDGITDITAAINGRTLPTQSYPATVEITGDDPIRVTWRFAEAHDSVNTFTLTYRVLGVVRQGESADLLQWQALPDDYDYPIGRSQVTFDWPGNVELSAEPSLVAGEGNLERGSNRLVWTGQNLEPDDPLVVEIPFAAGSLISAPPAWQARQIERDRYAWVWAVVAGILTLVSFITFALFARSPQYRTGSVGGPSYHPPADLSPALAGMLREQSTHPNWSTTLGTLFDLAGRNVLVIEEKEKSAWYSSHDFIIRQIAFPPDLLPHEEGLLRLIFTDKSGQKNEVKLSQLNKVITSSHWKPYAEGFEAELKAAGFLSAERQQAKRRLQIAATVWLFAAVAFLALTLILMQTFGGWPLLVTGSLFVVAMVGYATAGSRSVLSETGEQAAAEWKAFYHYLRDVSRGKAAVSQPDMFEQYLPYAAAFGLLAAWAKQFKKTGWTKVPPYFHALGRANGDSMAAFVVLTSSTASSGGAASAAGAAGAGAAGGGSSGAG